MAYIQEIVDTFIENPLLATGYYGPLILIGINMYHLYNRFFWLVTYFIFVIINTIINKELKKWIKEPRPIGWKSFATFEKLENEESYGMPSGHAQSAMFSVVFYYLLFGIDEVLYIMILITTLTVYQRFLNKNHTGSQLIIGLFIGGFIGWSIVYVAKKYKKKISLLSI